MNIILSGNLRRFTDYEGEVQLEAATVTEALGMLVTQFPDLKPVIYDSYGQPRSMHLLYLNGDMLDASDKDHELQATDELGIITSIAGG